MLYKGTFSWRACGDADVQIVLYTPISLFPQDSWRWTALSGEATTTNINRVTTSGYFGEPLVQMITPHVALNCLVNCPPSGINLTLQPLNCLFPKIFHWLIRATIQAVRRGDCVSLHKQASLLEWIGTAVPRTCSSFLVATQRSCSKQTSPPAGLWSTASNRRPCNSLPSPCARTMRCLTCASAPWSVSWRTGFRMPAQRCKKARASQRKPGATSLGHSKRHQAWRREPLASTTMAHSSMRRRWNKRSHRRRKRTSSSWRRRWRLLGVPESTVTAARPSNKIWRETLGFNNSVQNPPEVF